MKDKRLEMDYSSWDIDKWLTKHWNQTWLPAGKWAAETFDKALTDAFITEQDKTCWPVIYRGTK